jgi:hypothetical protein
MSRTTVRIGLVPTYWKYELIGAWCVKMRDESLKLKLAGKFLCIQAVVVELE